MRFWDSSGIVPLLVFQQFSERVKDILSADDGAPIVWWGTFVECSSALARLEREQLISSLDHEQALDILKLLAASWHEVQPSRILRDKAARLLRLHTLRSADALQLAAALIASEDLSVPLEVVCFDERLSIAARREGFSVIDS